MPLINYISFDFVLMGKKKQVLFFSLILAGPLRFKGVLSIEYCCFLAQITHFYLSHGFNWGALYLKETHREKPNSSGF